MASSSLLVVSKDDVLIRVKQKVGNGYNTRFWLDKWVGENVALCENFPRLFRLEIDKDISVGEKRCWRDGGWAWDWSWTRNPRGRAITELMELTTLTNFFVPNVQLDSWSWLLDDKGIFTVKSLREKIDEVALNATITPQKTKWNTYIPRKTCIFVWRLQQRRLPVRSWLHHIGMDLNTILCPHCDTDIETFEHCFMSCPRVVTGWEKVFKWWNMGNFNVGSVGDIINYNGQNNYNAMQKKCWQAVCWGMLYVIWCIRNKRVFQNKISNLATICDEVQVLVYFWISHRAKGKIASWIEWCIDPVNASKG
ncbi:RNA-directed DNA polymerase, eukaryota, reverse transcriptase zinc-binding domain protein [Tanacetum coccineum]